MNDVSRKILSILEQDARTHPELIATMLGTDVADVRRQIADLETARILLRYKAIVNWEKAGTESVMALIEVRVSPQREVGFDAIAERIARFAEARSVYLISGTYDLAVQVQGRTMKDVSAFVSEKLAPLEGVQGTTTHFMLKRYKDDGELFEEPAPPPRLAVSP